MVFFYAPTGRADPGFYGWAVVLEWLREGGVIYFRPVSPSDRLKMHPWWDEKAAELAERIRGRVKQGTLWRVPEDLVPELREGLVAWACSPGHLSGPFATQLDLSWASTPLLEVDAPAQGVRPHRPQHGARLRWDQSGGDPGSGVLGDRAAAVGGGNSCFCWACTCSMTPYRGVGSGRGPRPVPWGRGQGGGRRVRGAARPEDGHRRDGVQDGGPAHRVQPSPTPTPKSPTV